MVNIEARVHTGNTHAVAYACLYTVQTSSCCCAEHNGRSRAVAPVTIYYIFEDLLVLGVRPKPGKTLGALQQKIPTLKPAIQQPTHHNVDVRTQLFIV